MAALPPDPWAIQIQELRSRVSLQHNLIDDARRELITVRDTINAMLHRLQQAPAADGSERPPPWRLHRVSCAVEGFGVNVMVWGTVGGHEWMKKVTLPHVVDQPLEVRRDGLPLIEPLPLPMSGAPSVWTAHDPLFEFVMLGPVTVRHAGTLAQLAPNRQTLIVSADADAPRGHDPIGDHSRRNRADAIPVETPDPDAEYHRQACTHEGGPL